MSAEERTRSRGLTGPEDVPDRPPRVVGAIAISGVDAQQPGFAPRGAVETGGPHPEIVGFGLHRYDAGIDTLLAGYDDPIRVFLEGPPVDQRDLY